MKNVIERTDDAVRELRNRLEAFGKGAGGGEKAVEPRIAYFLMEDCLPALMEWSDLPKQKRGQILCLLIETLGPILREFMVNCRHLKN